VYIYGTTCVHLRDNLCTFTGQPVYIYGTTCVHLWDNLCTFMMVSCWILLRIRNVLDKSCKENQNTHFMFSNFFLKIVLFMTYSGKSGRTGQTTDECDVAHVLGMLNN
jgi:hypothetical protein